MTRWGVLVTRRFVARVAGDDVVTECSRAVELAIPPVPGMRLAFTDGSPECTVSMVRHRCGLGPVQGVIPSEIELLCCKEKAAGLEAALAAGWQRTDAAP